MIVTDHFVFLHLHKSGGTFVNDCLMRFMPDARRIGYHLPRSLVPPDAARLPVLGLVRNPWSYYVSWYAFQKRKAMPNALFRILSDDGRLPFEGTVRNMLELTTGSPQYHALLAALPRHYGARGLNLPAPAFAQILASDRGFYSFLYGYLYSGTGLRLIGRMEWLRHDVVSMLTSVGQGLSSGMRAFIADEPPRNVSEHRPYHESYSAALRDLVAERDAAVIDAHGYRFGDPPLEAGPIAIVD